VRILNAGFSPSTVDIENAERVVALAREAALMQRGSFAIDGRMIDMPVVQRANGVLARARAIAKRRAGSAGKADLPDL
jgi:citrate lyase subunit beta/citryl-CoA lyase